MGFFSKIKEGLRKTKEAIAYKLDKLFTGGVLDDDFFEELEMILLSSDIGAEATDEILERLREGIDERRIREKEGVLQLLREIMQDILDEVETPDISYPCVLLITGVNGTGKTTACGKLADKFRRTGKSVMLAAADTFRAAAADQLQIWAERAGVKIVRHYEGSDPSAVVFDAMTAMKARNADILIVDTAGRLHNKKNLMEELKKISRVIQKELPNACVLNLLVLDATTGQNAVTQAELFNEAVEIDGIILTKLDGTAKGGVVLAIAKEQNIPVVYIGVGEGIDDLQDFSAKEFVSGII